MFCGKCGNELKESVQFCGKCGAAIENNRQQIMKENHSGVEQSTRISGTGNISTLLIGISGLSILQLILWYVDMMKVTALYIASMSFSIHDQMEEGGVAFLSVITVILCLTSTVLSLLPALQGGLKKRNRMIIQHTAGIWCLGWFLYMVGESNAIAKEAGGLTEVSLTFGGWLYLLVSIALIALAFGTSVKSKTLV